MRLGTLQGSVATGALFYTFEIYVTTVITSHNTKMLNYQRYNVKENNELGDIPFFCGGVKGLPATTH